MKELAVQKSRSFTPMIKNFLIAFILVTIITIALLGFQGQHRQATGIEFFGDMKRQDKGKFQKPSSFFADGRAARPPVDGAIPMGYDIPGHPMQNSGAPTGGRHRTSASTGGVDCSLSRSSNKHRHRERLHAGERPLWTSAGSVGAGR